VFDLDTSGAYGIFFGKSIDEAISLIARDSLHHNENLSAMPPRCLRYYIRAYIAYLSTDDSRQDSLSAFCFLSLVKSRLADLKGANAALMDSLIGALPDVAGRPEWPDVPDWRSGELRSRSVELLNQLQA